MATSNTTPIVIPQPFAAQATSENINVIPNGATGTNGASFQEGFPAITRMPVIENPLPTQVSGLPPKQQDFNGIFNAVSQHNFFAQNGGLYSFNQAVSDAIGGYAKNQILWYFPATGLPVPVLSMIDNNTYNFAENPSFIDGQKWRYFIPDSNLDHLSTTGQAKFDAKANIGLDNITTEGQNVILNLAAQRGNPTGTIIVWSAHTPPDGYLICNGAAVSRTTYVALFKVIGTTWGAGDGNTTFNVPNFNYKSVWQDPAIAVGTSMVGSLPNITASWTAQGTSQDSRRPVLYNGTGAINTGTYRSGGGLACTLTNTWDGQTAQDFNASRSSAVYQDGQTQVVPASNMVLFCIRY